MKQVRPLKLLRSYTTEFSKTGSLLLTLSRDVVVWDVGRRVKRYRVHPLSHPSHSSIHPNEEKIVIKNTAGQIALLAASDGMLIRLLEPAKGNEGSNILHSSCGEYVVDGSWNGQLTVRSATSGKVAFQKEFPGEMIKRIVSSDDGGTWFVIHQPKAVSREASLESAYISIWSWPFTSPTEFVRATENGIDALAVSPDNRKICIVGNSSVSVMELAEKRIVCSVPYNFGGTAFVAKWSPDSEEIATVQRHSFVFYDASTLEKRKSIELQYASDIAYSPDSSQLALGAWESGMLIKREKSALPID